VARDYPYFLEERKRCSICIDKYPKMIENPQKCNKSYDKNKVGLWEYWQGNQFSKIVVVGQDWGDVGYYEAHNGRDDPNNITNKNIVELFASIGLSIDPLGTTPRKYGELFFTNAILCLKTEGGLHGKTKDEWYQDCINTFLKPMMEEIIKPKLIIILGKKASIEISRYSDTPLTDKMKMREIIERNFKVFNADAYPVYHPGAIGLFNRYRAEMDLNSHSWSEYSKENALAIQKKDWQRFRGKLKELGITR
jgi:hypothetical protein